jgi:Ca2+-binding EF-hand superfamily protein
MQQEKPMKKSTKLAFAFATLAGLVGTAAHAEQNKGGDMREGSHWRLQKALKDSDGGITFDQFSEAMNPELKKILADNGGKVTVEQLAAALEKARFERMAKRMVERYDSKGEGVLTQEDVTAHQKKMFALFDKNNDGKIEKSELPKRGGRDHRQSEVE